MPGVNPDDRRSQGRGKYLIPDFLFSYFKGLDFLIGIDWNMEYGSHSKKILVLVRKNAWHF